jgi:hypothetical protein
MTIVEKVEFAMPRGLIALSEVDRMFTDRTLDLLHLILKSD